VNKREMSATTRALLVLVLTDKTRAFLMESDPKALAQAVGALLYGSDTPGLSPEALAILTLTDDLLIARGVRPANVSPRLR